MIGNCWFEVWIDFIRLFRLFCMLNLFVILEFVILVGLIFCGVWVEMFDSILVMECSDFGLFFVVVGEEGVVLVVVLLFLRFF